MTYHFRQSRFATRLFVVLLWIAAYLTLDFTYSFFFLNSKPPARIPNPVYHHGFQANFDSFDDWGPNHYKLSINSLGFKDRAAGEVLANPDEHRIVLIGDSFTEGIGLPFEDTFAGLLYWAGQSQPQEVGFLNAGVSSYSPTIYYKKIRFLIEKGLRFDEVVIFSDMSDVIDEASKYFCIDDDPQFATHCGWTDTYIANFLKARLGHWFALTNDLRRIIMNLLSSKEAYDQGVLQCSSGEWPIAGNSAPLGIYGGIDRSLKNMTALSDLLREHGILMTIVVYPYPAQLVCGDLDSRQVALWRQFCVDRCRAFINLFPVFFAEKRDDPDWYEHLFIAGDVHYNRAGHRVIFRELAKVLFYQSR